MRRDPDWDVPEPVPNEPIPAHPRDVADEPEGEDDDATT